MPGVFNLSVDEAVKEARETFSLGVPSVILFGLPEKKDEIATGAWADDGIVQQAARAIKREVPELVIMGDGPRAGRRRCPVRLRRPPGAALLERR